MLDELSVYTPLWYIRLCLVHPSAFKRYSCTPFTKLYFSHVVYLCTCYYHSFLYLSTLSFPNFNVHIRQAKIDFAPT